MKFRLKYFILLVAMLIAGAGFSRLLSSAELLARFGVMIFKSFAFAKTQISFEILDLFFSVIALPCTAFYALFSRCSILNSRLNILSGTIVILLYIFLFPGVITNGHPDFYSSLEQTKLLSPLASAQKIISNEGPACRTSEENFLLLKNRLISPAPESIQYKRSTSTNLQNDGHRIFILGTDEFGRDIFTRIIFGTRISFITAIFSVFITLLLGLVLGFTAGITGGLVDSVLNRISEMFLSIPMIFLIILFAAFFGSSVLAVIILLGFTGWMSLFKIVRGEIILIKSKDYFISSKMLGLSRTTLLFREIIPIISVPVVINLIFQFGNIILAEAALSYLGLSGGGSYPTWGGMIQEGQSYIYTAWWMILFPGVMLFVSLFTINSIGKQLSIYFNPRLNYDK